jgi:hypothetical protein
MKDCFSQIFDRPPARPEGGPRKLRPEEVSVSGCCQLSVGSSQQERAECRQSPMLRDLRVLRAMFSTAIRVDPTQTATQFRNRWNL